MNNQYLFRKLKKLIGNLSEVAVSRTCNHNKLRFTSLLLGLTTPNNLFDVGSFVN